MTHCRRKNRAFRSLVSCRAFGAGHDAAQIGPAGDGAASETLREYPGHCAMLLFRSRDGAAEVHENFADVFYVLDGHARW